MIFDFPVFLYTILPAIKMVSQIVIGITATILLLEWIYKFRLVAFGHILNKNEILVLLIVNILTQLVVFPCADIGANCWMNCFGFTFAGNLGYFSSYATLGCIVVLSAIFYWEKIKFAAVPVIFLYGIFGFLQIAYLDKGLWCIVRSSGYEYLWTSFEIVIAIQWLVYFATMTILYLDIQTRHEYTEGYLN
jgi:hypothetical protein